MSFLFRTGLGPATFGACIIAVLGLMGSPAAVSGALNEGTEIEVTPNTNSGAEDVSFTWFGSEGRTYFIEQSTDLTSDWTYVPVILRGAGEAMGHGFSTNSDALFLRLKYTDFVYFGDPNLVDLDGDGVGSWDELTQNTDPFTWLSADSDPLPDDWEIFHGLDLQADDSFADPDLDSQSNFFEFENSSDPNDYFDQYPQIKASVQLISGEGQTSATDTFATNPLITEVTDTISGRVLPNAPIEITVEQGGGQISLLNTGANLETTIDSRTDANGRFLFYYQQPSVDAVTSLIDVSSGGAETTLSALSGVSASPAGVKMEITVLPDVSNSWQRVSLLNDYTEMVVVATPQYGAGDPPLVTRIRNASGNVFEIKLQNPGDDDDIAEASYPVHIMVVEAGVYTEAADGIKMEAFRFDSTITDGRNQGYVGQSANYQNSYTDPVVLGQVMTANDADWSVFWARGNTRSNPPRTNDLYVGKHIVEDSDETRADETLGVIIFEQPEAVDQVGGFDYLAGVGSDTIEGFEDTGSTTPSPPYAYSLTGLANAEVRLLSSAAMDVAQGGWPILYGANTAASELNLAIDEDQIRDNERRHGTEQVAYVVFDNAFIDTDADLLDDRAELRVIDSNLGDSLNTLYDIEPSEDLDGDGQDNLSEINSGSDPLDFYDQSPAVAPDLQFVGGASSVITAPGVWTELIEVSITDSLSSQPLSGAPVTISVSEGGATLSTILGAASSAQSLTVSADSSGVAGFYIQQPEQGGTISQIQITAVDQSLVFTSSTNGGIIPFEHGTIQNVGAGWHTVYLVHDYGEEMVVVATPEYNSSEVSPVVTRVRNASGRSFEVKLQVPTLQVPPEGAIDPAIEDYDIHYLVVKAGEYSEALFGTKLVAGKTLSTETSGALFFNDHLNDPFNLNTQFNFPVVLGQVMTENDPRWSVFWAYGSFNGPDRTSPPNSNDIFIGKHIAEGVELNEDGFVLPPERIDETIGYVIMESGSVNLAAQATTGELIESIEIDSGVTDPFVYESIEWYIGSPGSSGPRVVASAGMQSTRGDWPILNTDEQGDSFDLQEIIYPGIEEDQILDSEQSPTAESVAYLAMSPFYGSEVPTFSIVDGNRQITTPGSLLPAPLTVLVERSGAPMSGMTVYFKMIEGTGELSAVDGSGTSATLLTATTDSDGLARMNYIYSSDSAEAVNRIQAFVPHVENESVIFETITYATDDVIEIEASALDLSVLPGDGQTADIILYNTTDEAINYQLSLNGDTVDQITGYSYEDSINGSLVDDWETLQASHQIGIDGETIDDRLYFKIDAFEFPFYDREYAGVFFYQNGFISLAFLDYISSGLRDLPDEGTGFPDDLFSGLITAGASELAYTHNFHPSYRQFADRVVIQYSGISADPIAQIVLYADGRIRFNYQNLTNAQYNHIIGIQQRLGLDGTTVRSHNSNGSTNMPGNLVGDLSILFTPQVTSEPAVSFDQNTGSLGPDSYVVLSADVASGLQFGDTVSSNLQITHDHPSAPAFNATISVDVPDTRPQIVLESHYEGQKIHPEFQAPFPVGENSYQLSLEGENAQLYPRVIVLKDGEIIRASNLSAENTSTYTVGFADEDRAYELEFRAYSDQGDFITSSTLWVQTFSDLDQDSLDDAWEETHFGTSVYSGNDDPDGDGFYNLYEFHHDTDPNNASEAPVFAENQAPGPNYYSVDASLTAEEETAFKFRRLEEAVAVANYFDIIEIRAGEYILSEPLTTNQPLLYRSVDGVRETIVSRGSVDNFRILTLENPSILDGLSFTGANQSVRLRSRDLPVSTQTAHLVINCLFYGNRAPVLQVTSADAEIISTTITDNLPGANSAPRFGAAVTFDVGTFNPTFYKLSLTNCILWNQGPELGIDDEDYLDNRSLSGTLHRSTETGLAWLDEVEQNGVSDSGLNAFYALGPISFPVDRGTPEALSRIDFEYEVRADGLIDIGADEWVDLTSGGAPGANGLADNWEAFYGVSDPAGDADGDGLLNLEEHRYLADPVNTSDTDGDSYTDFDEVKVYGTPAHIFTDPEEILTIDSDGDGLPNFWEFANGLDFNDPSDALISSDGDSLNNLTEYRLGYDPNLADSEGNGTLDDAEDADSDGLNNLIEQILDYAPNSSDSDYDRTLDGDEDFDGDGMSNLWEVMHGLDYLSDDSALDQDGDGILNGEEFAAGLDPTNQDQNQNGLDDGDPADDADGDGIPNHWEQGNGLDWLDPEDGLLDLDVDGLSTFWEYTLGYDHTDPESVTPGVLDGDLDQDLDTLPNAWEVTYGFDPDSPPGSGDENTDNDNDALLAQWEFLLGTDPNNPDTDGDLILDGYEDQDGDGIADYFELTYINLDPDNANDATLDLDNDNLSALEEFYLGTSPDLADTDGNGTDDDLEDADGDLITNLWELENGLDPRDPIDATENPDGDYQSNLSEFQSGNDPTSADSDGDDILDGDTDSDGNGLGDLWEADHPGAENPAQDTDLDGVLNGDEYSNQTDPLVPDGLGEAFKVYTPLEP